MAATCLTHPISVIDACLNPRTTRREAGGILEMNSLTVRPS